MTDQRPQAEHRQNRPYRVSPVVRGMLRQRQRRAYLQRMQQPGIAPRRYWVRSQRAYARNLIRGDLVAHRRMFGVSHKSVQPGQSPVESGE